MKSKIKFVTTDEPERTLKDYIRGSFHENGKGIIPITFCYEMLLYVKYIIEREGLDYTKVIDGDEGSLNSLKSFVVERFGELLWYRFVERKGYEFLKKIAFEDYELQIYNDRVLDSYIDKNKKYLLISNYRIPYIKYPNVDMLDLTHKAQIIRYQTYDEINGINRKYLTSPVSIHQLKEYDSVIYINDGREYVSLRDLIHEYKLFADIFMICKYKDISKFKDSFTSTASIIVDKEKAYVKRDHTLLRNNEDNKILLKDVSNVPDEELKNIINSNKEIKDISVFIEIDDFKKHHGRIGLSSYKKNLSLDKEKILRLVDYSDAMVRRLRELDDEISKQIDEMIIR